MQDSGGGDNMKIHLVAQRSVAKRSRQCLQQANYCAARWTVGRAGLGQSIW